MTPFKKLEPVRIFEQVVHQIRDLVKQGEFGPGDKLPPEQELEKQLNVSRSSIREALRVLEVEGLIEVRRGSGTYITSNHHKKTSRGDLTLWLEQRQDMLMSVLHVREYVEGLTASFAATLASEETLAELNDVIAEITVVIGQSIATNEVDFDKMAELDSRFHLIISKASGNVIAIDIMSQIIPAFQESNKVFIYMEGRLDNLIREHDAIKAAIESRNPKAAEDAMRRHIARVRNELEEFLNGSLIKKTNGQA